MGQADSAACHNHLTTIKEICRDLGIPLAIEKLEGPSQCITFLGITLDTQRMEAQLPSDKLLRIRNQLSAWLTQKKATKREILSLVGLLQHACKVVRPGRSFVSRMYITAAKLKQLSHYTCLSKDFRSDQICIGGMPSFPYGTGQVFYRPLFIRPISITPSTLMPQDHGVWCILLPSLVPVCLDY